MPDRRVGLELEMTSDSQLHPFFRHSRWPAPAPIAHRGYSARYPENTMPAFEAAVALGYEYLETDIHATADGRIVICHDDDLRRLTGAPRKITEMGWSDVRRLKVAGTESLPLLAELFDAFPCVKVNIDPKHDNAVPPLLRLLREMNAWHRVCIGSFSERRLKSIRRAAGDKVCTSAGPREVFRLKLLSLGCPVGRLQANCVQAPPCHRGIRVIDAGFVAASHAIGMPVHAWTINEAAEMKRLLAIGVDGIVTAEAETAFRLFTDQIWPQEGA